MTTLIPNELIDTTPAVAGHTKAGNIQIWNGASALSNFDVDGNVTVATWEKFGPTGAAGIDNTWTALDQLPSTATVLIAQLYCIFNSNSSTANGQVWVSAQPGSVVTPSYTGLGGDVKTRLGGLMTAGNDVNGITTVYIPLDPSDQTFHLYWSYIGQDSAFVTMSYQGFIAP